MKSIVNLLYLGYKNYYQSMQEIYGKHDEESKMKMQKELQQINEIKEQVIRKITDIAKQEKSPFLVDSLIDSFKFISEKIRVDRRNSEVMNTPELKANMSVEKDINSMIQAMEFQIITEKNIRAKRSLAEQKEYSAKETEQKGFIGKLKAKIREIFVKEDKTANERLHRKSENQSEATSGNGMAKQRTSDPEGDRFLNEIRCRRPSMGIPNFNNQRELQPCMRYISKRDYERLKDSLPQFVYDEYHRPIGRIVYVIEPDVRRFESYGDIQRNR